ncbi:YcnI family protein [Methylophaga sp.]|uniref:YcnI family copper-binding membrane protein n=1 Tax=Methylophaga sp. TaxID=2024840 RepID=UPI0027289D05|nr:YcnI family protein [Methylophaga sp.]MDO8826106.1 YcnI family protein [Methylophaga sp.]
MMKNKLLCLAMLIPGLANAQVFLEQTQAESGSYYKGVLTVIAGCDGSATTRITVDIPEGLQFVQPMPKAGWQLEVVKRQVERPFFKDGVEITEAVRQITWSGSSLSDIHFDEFIFRGRIGVGATSVLYFPVTQKCESGELHWDQIAEIAVETRGQVQGQYRQMDFEEDEEEFRQEPEQSVNQATEPSDDHSQHQHQHGKAKQESEHSGDHSQHKNHQHQHAQAKAETDHSAHQHHHDHQMDMTKEDDEMDHSAHAGHGGHGQSTLQYPAPFVSVVDGTGDHHHH